jgi:hypothetical protein
MFALKTRGKHSPMFMAPSLFNVGVTAAWLLLLLTVLAIRLGG